MTGEQLLIKTIKQCNAFEARVKYLESDEYVNNLKADAIDKLAGIMRREFGDSTGRFMNLYTDKLRK